MIPNYVYIDDEPYHTDHIVKAFGEWLLFDYLLDWAPMAIMTKGYQLWSSGINYYTDYGSGCNDRCVLPVSASCESEL